MGCLDLSLQIAHIMYQSQAPVAACTSCNEVDHRPEDGALASLQRKVSYTMARDWSAPYPGLGNSLGHIP